MKDSFTMPFLCPECGSARRQPYVPHENGNRTGRRYVCANCQLEVPVHLAERWGGISIADAAKEWREVYRDPEHASPHESKHLA